MNKLNKQSLVVSIFNALIALIECGGKVGHWSDESADVLFLRRMVESFQQTGFPPGERRGFWDWAKAQPAEKLFDLLLEVEVYERDSHTDYPEFYSWVHCHDSSWRVDSVGSKPATGYNREYIIPYYGKVATPTKYVEAKWEGGEWKY